MGRIRSIKPEFWTDDKIVELSPFARLFFIGLWNFVDDFGRCQYSPKSLKLKILPNDKIDLDKIFFELSQSSLILIYTVEDKEYLQVRNFSEHQKIDKRRDSKFPPPISPVLPQFPPTSPNLPPRRGRDQGGEGKGRDQGEDQGGDQGGAPKIGAPHEAPISKTGCELSAKEIVKLYHDVCPELPQVKVLTPAREKQINARLREYPDRYFWLDLFTQVKRSDFLSGLSPPREGNDRPFKADLEWITKQGNFVKILEGKYENGTNRKNLGKSREQIRQQRNQQVLDEYLAEATASERGDADESSGDIIHALPSA